MTHIEEVTAKLKEAGTYTRIGSLHIWTSKYNKMYEKLINGGLEDIEVLSMLKIKAKVDERLCELRLKYDFNKKK